MTKNQGQKARDDLAAAVNRAQDEETVTVECLPHVAGDVIEQRDTLLKTLKALVGEPVRYNDRTIEIDCGCHSDAMRRVYEAREAIKMAEGKE